MTIDPDSPPGKEYALPLDSARGQAAPSSDPPWSKQLEYRRKLRRPGRRRRPRSGLASRPPPSALQGSGNGVNRSGIGVNRAATNAPGDARPRTARIGVARVPAAERSASVSNGAIGPLLWSGLSAAALVAIGLGIGVIRRRTDRQTR